MLWIINVYLLVMVGLLLGVGMLGDCIGYCCMFLIGLVVFGVVLLVVVFVDFVV